MSDVPGYDIRYTNLEDLRSLQEWFKEKDAYNDFPFNANESGEMLKNWIGFSKFKASLTGIVDNVPCAIGTLFLMPYRKVAHHCSFYLIVDPKYRRKGIGTSMLKNLIHLAKSRFRIESIHVEIYDGSHLLPILNKLGFTEIVRQENYMKLGNKHKARMIWEHTLT